MQVRKLYDRVRSLIEKLRYFVASSRRYPFVIFLTFRGSRGSSSLCTLNNSINRLKRVHEQLYQLHTKQSERVTKCYPVVAKISVSFKKKEKKTFRVFDPLRNTHLQTSILTPFSNHKQNTAKRSASFRCPWHLVRNAPSFFTRINFRS